MAFVDTEMRPAGEVQQKVGRLSDVVRECGYDSPDSLQECILGRAYTRITGRCLLEDTYSSAIHRYRWIPIVSEALNIPAETARYAEKMCYDGQSPSQIADWLEAQGL